MERAREIVEIQKELFSMSENKCAICRNVAQSTPTDRDAYRFSCPTCGNYEISREAIPDTNQLAFQSKAYILSGVTRNISEDGGSVTISTTNIKELLDTAPIPKDPLEMIDRILLYVARKTKTADSAVELSFTRDYPIAFAQSGAEFEFVITKAMELDYLEPIEGDKYRLGFEGWRRVSELRKTERDSNQAFVAMWFSEELLPIWRDGFKKALEETGYDPIRIDLMEYNEKICDRIVAEIRRSGLLVGDFTGNRGGVYFETGFAMGRGIPVIWTCRDTDIKKVHFDTRQYNHIVWTDSNDLKEKLINRIEATLPGRVRRSSRA